MAKKEQSIYRIKPEYIGKEVWTIIPEYPREGGGRFVLDENLSQTDLTFLAQVIGHDAIEQVS